MKKGMNGQRIIACIALGALSCVLAEATEGDLGQRDGAKPSPVRPSDEAAIQERLEGRLAQMSMLKDRASTVTKNLSALAASGNIPTSQEAIQAMREMVDELQKIQQTLDSIQQEVASIKKWIGDSKATPASMSKSIADLSKSKWGGYIQFQYRDTDQVGGATDAFNVRRARLGLTQTIDPKTSLRVTFDVATGTTSNSAQMRDAFVRYEAEEKGDRRVGTEFVMGQLQLPLGYEIERSSGLREFPERTLYNRTMFAGERSRGVNVRHGIGPNVVVQVGGWNALTVDDPEQRSVAPGPENRLAMTGSVRYYGKGFDAGVSGLFGERPSVQTTRTVNNATVTTTHPRVDRELVFVDATVNEFLVKNAFLRFEYLFGKDRVPITPGTQQNITSARGRSDVQGHQIHVGYNFNPRNQLNVRFEAWDPDADIAGNTVDTWGLAYSYFINPNARLTLSREWVDDPSRAGIDDERYEITTLRVVFRF